MGGPEFPDMDWDEESYEVTAARDLGEGCGHMDERTKAEIGRDIEAAEEHLKDIGRYDPENPYGR